MLRKVVDFIGKAVGFGKETYQVISHDERVLEAIIQHIPLPFDEFVRTSHYLLIVVPELRVKDLK